LAPPSQNLDPPSGLGGPEDSHFLNPALLNALPAVGNTAVTASFAYDPSLRSRFASGTYGDSSERLVQVQRSPCVQRSLPVRAVAQL